MPPCPKPSRVKNGAFSQMIRARDGRCIAGMFLKDGMCVEVNDAHHIDTKGSGGGDTYENGILLCRYHHQLAHLGKILKQQLHAWLHKLYGYEEE